MNDIRSLSHPIGILSQGDIFIPVLKKDSLLPCSKTVCFCTTKDYQTRAEIVFCIRDQESTRFKEVYRFILSNLESQMSGVSKIDINMTLDDDFLLRVKIKTSAQEYFIDAFKVDDFFQTNDFVENRATDDKHKIINIDNLIESCHKINRNDQTSIDLPERKSFRTPNTNETGNKEALKKLKEIAIKTSQENAL